MLIRCDEWNGRYCIVMKFTFFYCYEKIIELKATSYYPRYKQTENDKFYVAFLIKLRFNKMCE